MTLLQVSEISEVPAGCLCRLFFFVYKCFYSEVIHLQISVLELLFNQLLVS